MAIHGRQGETKPLVELMAELNLQSLLPRGIVTDSARAVSSTIDLIFTTARLAEEVEQSEVYDCNHGSDHEAIHSRFSTAIPLHLSAPRLIFKNAPWAKICQEISNSTARITASAKDVDIYTQQLMSIITEAIYKRVPKAKPSPYAKRWWTESLSVLRKSHTRLRNQIRHRRRNREDYSPHLDAQAWVAKNVYFKAIREQKKKHWEDFLEDNENIWQASKYLSNNAGTSSFATISGLKTTSWLLATRK